MMPQDLLAGKRRLADVMRGEQGDVWPDEERGDVEQTVVSHKAHPERVPGDKFVREFLTAEFRVTFLKPGDMVACLRHQPGIDDTAKDHVAVLVVLLRRCFMIQSSDAHG